MINTATNTVTATIPVGVSPTFLDITPDGAFAYVSNFFSGSVSVIDTATNTVIALVNVGLGFPAGVAINPDGTFAYVAILTANVVLRIDTATNTVTASIPVGNGPAGVAFPTRAPTVVDPIDSLIAQVQALIAGGSLTQTQGDALIGKLHEIRTKINNGQTNGACNQLSSFINQVQGFINNGSLTASQGQALIDAANAIKSTLGC